MYWLNWLSKVAASDTKFRKGLELSAEIAIQWGDVQQAFEGGVGRDGRGIKALAGDGACQRDALLSHCGLEPTR
jgi:hypothetical protein